jgi:uncharacterized protein YcbK (DUF882 family)
VRLRAARQRSVALRAFGVGARLGLAALFMLGGNRALQSAVAEGDTRTVSFHHVHTGEDITVTFKRDGRYVPEALAKLDWFMRDWRKGRETHMDPHLFDLLWEAYRDVGGEEPIQVICGFRSPETNAMLRARSTGVAQFSQHINGQAMDFYIPGVPLEKIREVGLRMQMGGVGFYPTSGSPFVHLDTGTVRHWPQIARAQLIKIFPDGRTVHIPSDGVPLPGYKLALADVERHGAVPSPNSLEAAREAGIITVSDEQVAEAAAAAPKKRSLLARLFGVGKDKDEGYAPVKPRATVVASLIPLAASPATTARIVPMPTARPVFAVAAATLEPKDEPVVTASLGPSLGPVERGGDLPAPLTGTLFATTAVSASPVTLAFAEDTPMPRAASGRLRPMGVNLPRLPAEVPALIASAAPAPVAKPLLAGGVANVNSPWLRAAMLTPSVRYGLTAEKTGRYDPRVFAALLKKPQTSVVMTFSADPHYGMVADRFDGRAVVFLATATFTPPQTLSMR